jgi:hypothetical protein
MEEIWKFSQIEELFDMARLEEVLPSSIDIQWQLRVEKAAPKECKDLGVLKRQEVRINLTDDAPIYCKPYKYSNVEHMMI